MKRRTSSRDDLFLSALDMYTLLSLVLIGLAFMSTKGQRELKALDLPTFEGESTAPTEEILTVRWAEDRLLQPQLAPTSEQQKNQCSIEVYRPHGSNQSQGADARGSQPMNTPCYPRAFFSNALAWDHTQLAELRAQMQEENPPVAILCNNSKDASEASNAFACICLQWILAEAGFRVRALTSPP